MLAAFAVIAASFAQGCATAPNTPPAAAGQPSPKLAELYDIRTVLGPEEKTVYLQTGGPVKFNSYPLEAPPRLAVELRQTTSLLPSSPIIVEDNLLAGISVIDFKKAGVTRVEISLKKNVKSAALATGDGVEIRISPVNPAHDTGELASRLMDAEAKMASLIQDNESLKEQLGMLAARLAEYEGAQAGQPAEEEASAPSAQPDKAGVLALMERWRASWESGTLEDYQALYSPGFQSGGAGLDQWLAQTTSLFARLNGSQVRLYQRRITMGKNSAQVRMTAEFARAEGGAVKRESYRKQMTMAWTPQWGWLIESETDLPRN